MAAGRALCLDCAKQFDAGDQIPFIDIASAKLFCSEMVSALRMGCPGDGWFGLYGRFIRRAAPF